MELKDLDSFKIKAAIISNWLLRWLNLLTEITLTYRKNLHSATFDCYQIPSLHA